MTNVKGINKEKEAIGDKIKQHLNTSGYGHFFSHLNVSLITPNNDSADITTNVPLNNTLSAKLGDMITINSYDNSTISNNTVTALNDSVSNTKSD